MTGTTLFTRGWTEDTGVSTFTRGWVQTGLSNNITQAYQVIFTYYRHILAEGGDKLV